MCTKPGLVIGIDGPALQQFSRSAAAAFEAANPGTMLNRGIHKAYVDGAARLKASAPVEHLAVGKSSTTGHCTAPANLFSTTAQAILTTPHLTEEVFGPSSLLITCKDEAEMFAVAEQLEGQLTAALHMTEDDLSLAQALLPILERKAGRILVNGFPTGVEVCNAMVHGGPFPSTSDSHTTSVGSMAIERFLRPVCYQNFPAALLPEPLQNDNPLSIWRLVDGKLQQS